MCHVFPVSPSRDIPLCHSHKLPPPTPPPSILLSSYTAEKGLMEKSAHVLHCKLKNLKCRGGKCAGNCCCCFQDFVTSLCFLRVFARREKTTAHATSEKAEKKKERRQKKCAVNIKITDTVAPHPSKNKAARPPAATPAARLHYRKFTVCCLFDTHTCISYMLFVVMLRGKYCSH